MNLVDKLDEIIELNNKKLKELRKIQLEDTKRIGNYEYVLEFKQSLYYKVKEKEEINRKYNSEISELYEEINQKLTNGNKLVNPFK